MRIDVLRPTDFQWRCVLYGLWVGSIILIFVSVLALCFGGIRCNLSADGDLYDINLLKY